MSLVETVEKRGLEITLAGDPPAPTRFQWRVVRTVRREDGTDVTPPVHGFEDATEEDVSAYLDGALLQSRDDLAALAGAKAARVQELELEAAALTARAQAAESERDQYRQQYEQLVSEVEPV